MFQCALYGMAIRKFEMDHEQYNRIEKIYKNKQKKTFVYCDNQTDDVKSLVFYDLPDKNKQRFSVVTKIVKTEMSGTYENILTSLGYSLVRTNYITGYLYERNGYTIELSKFIKKIDSIDSSEEENEIENSNLPIALFDNFLVKVFTESVDVAAGEQVLQKASTDLADIVKLIKPNLSIF